ncbi:3-isopropylmalate dehydratase [Pseudomonas indica]|uniref:3-isopropylmalate dehydratase n=1 Tax=Pseudomonas indica TaxID=137658 RepID=A0A1G8YVJ6_9PSED|nr:3-isopropylmalate dehydratase [Pseudomonas indica]SDK06811.1 hypothetical protein SAMN05216186_104120 [Pseudomonas indica]
MRLIHAVLPVLALAGCSSFPAAPDKVAPVPDDRLLAFQEADAGSGQLVVERDLGFLGGGCYVAVLVDKQVAARIHVGESASFHLPPGGHLVGIGPDKQDEGICAMARLNIHRAFQLQDGENVHFRIVSEANGGFDIRPVER